LPYLDSPENSDCGSIDIQLEVLLQSAAMKERGQAPVRLSESNFKDAYWTVAQMLAHHTVNGCNLRPGDVLGTGTLSGPLPEQGGSLLELSGGGWKPVILPGGETRSFLLDGDTVSLRAACNRPGTRRLGFGLCEATVQPALPWPPP
jgi:fumarylacetoacetase